MCGIPGCTGWLVQCTISGGVWDGATSLPLMCFDFMGTLLVYPRTDKLRDSKESALSQFLFDSILAEWISGLAHIRGETQPPP